jgi:hypothetical protein
MRNNNYRFPWPNIALLAAPALLIMLSSTVSADTIVGWVEKVTITDNHLPVHAKLDTGADYSSLNTIDPVIYEIDEDKHIKFKLVNRDNNTIQLDRKIVRWTKIKNKFGVTRKRPVILLDICLNNISRVVEVNLVDRSNYKYQMLIGRNYLGGKPNLLVDSSKKYLHQPSCSKDK